MHRSAEKLRSTTLPENFAGSVEGRVTQHSYGKCNYKLFHGNENKPAIFLIPGFPLGNTQLDGFAAKLNKLGNRTVYSPGEMELKGRKAVPTLEKEALLYLSMIEREGRQDKPLQFVTHSYGMAVFEEMAKIAEDRGWKCFKHEDSKAVAVAPVGTSTKNKVFEVVKAAPVIEFLKLARRFGHFFLLAQSSGKVFDPDKKLLAENTHNVVKHLWKTAGEIRAIVGYKLDAQKLGKIACEMAIIDYPSDPMFGMKARAIRKGTARQLEHVDGIMTPVSVNPTLGRDRRTLKRKTREKLVEEIREAWPNISAKELNKAIKKELKSDFYRASHTARHDALIGNPGPTAMTVLQILNPEARLYYQQYRGKAGSYHSAGSLKLHK